MLCVIIITVFPISNNIFEFFLSKKKISILELSTIYGSLKIFKYLFNFNIKISNSILLYSLQSGNFDLIRLFDINNYKNIIIQNIETSLYYYFNDIYIWLKENFIIFFFS